jgi:hypothetical protein
MILINNGNKKKFIFKSNFLKENFKVIIWYEI